MSVRPLYRRRCDRSLKIYFWIVLCRGYSNVFSVQDGLYSKISRTCPQTGKEADMAEREDDRRHGRDDNRKKGRDQQHGQPKETSRRVQLYVSGTRERASVTVKVNGKVGGGEQVVATLWIGGDAAQGGNPYIKRVVNPQFTQVGGVTIDRADGIGKVTKKGGVKGTPEISFSEAPPDCTHVIALFEGTPSNQVMIPTENGSAGETKTASKRFDVRVNEATSNGENLAHLSCKDERDNPCAGTVTLTAAFPFQVDGGAEANNHRLTVDGRKTVTIVPSTRGVVRFFHEESREVFNRLVLPRR
jgi:hypothetical protein